MAVPGKLLPIVAGRLGLSWNRSQKAGENLLFFSTLT